jgi:RNase P subunit RPR2
MGLLAGAILRRIMQRVDVDCLNEAQPLTGCPHCKGPLTPTTDPTRRVLCLSCGWPARKR